MCDDTWDTADAQVACRQLGFSATGAMPLYDVPAGSGDIWLDGMSCDESEIHLSIVLLSYLDSTIVSTLKMLEWHVVSSAIY